MRRGLSGQSKNWLCLHEVTTRYEYSAKYAELLIKKGIDVLLWSDVGAPDAADSEIMAYARDNDFIVLTYDWILVRYC